MSHCDVSPIRYRIPCGPSAYLQEEAASESRARFPVSKTSLPTPQQESLFQFFFVRRYVIANMRFILSLHVFIPILYFEFEFYDPVNNGKVMSSRSVNY